MSKTFRLATTARETIESDGLQADFLDLSLLASDYGRVPETAKQLELAGWPYPKHLAGRAYGLIVHGDAEGVGALQSSLSDWLETIGLVSAGQMSNLGRYIGYLKPYATSHDDLDADMEVMEETRNVAHAVCRAIADLRASCHSLPDEALTEPRPK